MHGDNFVAVCLHHQEDWSVWSVPVTVNDLSRLIDQVNERNVWGCRPAFS